MKKLIFLGLCLLMINAPLPAQWSTTPDAALQIGVGERTEVISDGDGGAFVLWYAYPGTRIQKVDKYGYVKWTNITPQGGLDVGGSSSDSCWQASSTLHSGLVADGAGGVFVMFNDICCVADCGEFWEEIRSEALIQHFDSLGNALWGSGLPVSLRDVYLTYTGAIISDGTGGIIALYNEQDSVDTPARLHGQRFDNQGSRLWGEAGIFIEEVERFRDAKSDGAGGVVLNWDPSILQRIDGSGNLLWGMQGVSAAPAGAFELAVSAESDAIYVHNSGGILRVNKFSLTDGSLQWDSLGVTVDTISVNSDVYDFKLDSEQNIWIAWFDTPGAPLIQKFSPAGLPQFTLPGIPPSDFPSQKGGVRLQWGDIGNMLCVWVDSRHSENPLYGQNIGGDGQHKWLEDVLISTRSNISTRKEIFSSIDGKDLSTDSNGGFILNWWDLPSFGIYVQQVNRDGDLGNVLTSIPPMPLLPKAGDFLLYPNYPNPFNPNTTIRFYLAKASKAALAIYDIQGRLVKKWEIPKRSSGWYRLTWDGLNAAGAAVSSGIYYYRLTVGGKTQTQKMTLIR